MATDYDAVVAGTPVTPSGVTDYDAVVAAPKPALKGGAAGDFAMGLGQGATLGLGPYINAGIDTARGYLLPRSFGGNVSSDYATNLRVQKLAQDQAQANSPTAYGAGKVTGAVAAGVAGGAGLEAVGGAAGLGSTAANIAGNTVSNVAQGAVSGATNAAPGQAGEGAAQGATIGAVASGLGGLVGLSKLIGPSAAQVTVKSALAELEAAGGAPAFKGSTLSKLYPDAPNLTAARSLARADLNDVATATRVISGTAGAGVGGYEGYSAAKATGQGPMGQLAGATIGGVMGAAVGNKYVTPQVASTLSRAAPVATSMGPATNAVLNPTSSNAPTQSGLDSLLERARQWSGF